MHARVTHADRPLTKRALAKQHTRQKVLAKARELFRDRGYAGTTIRDIASEIDMSIGAVFSNFSSKIDLFSAVVAEEYEGYRRVFDTMPADMALQDRVVSLLAIDYEPDRIALLRCEMERSWSTEGGARSCARTDYVHALITELLPSWNATVVVNFTLDVWALHLDLCRMQSADRLQRFRGGVRRAMRRTS